MANTCSHNTPAPLSILPAPPNPKEMAVLGRDELEPRTELRSTSSTSSSAASSSSSGLVLHEADLRQLLELKCKDGAPVLWLGGDDPAGGRMSSSSSGGGEDASGGGGGGGKGAGGGTVVYSSTQQTCTAHSMSVPSRRTSQPCSLSHSFLRACLFACVPAFRAGKCLVRNAFADLLRSLALFSPP